MEQVASVEGKCHKVYNYITCHTYDQYNLLVIVSQGLLEINKIIIHCYTIVINKTNVFKAIISNSYFFPSCRIDR